MTSGSICANRLRFRKVVDVRLPRQAAQISLLARVGLNGFLESLVGGDPQILAQRIVVAIDSHRSRRSDKPPKAFIADEIGAVQLVRAHARFHIHEAVACVRAGHQRAELPDDLFHVEIEQSVFDVIGTHRLVGARNLQFQARFRARHFVAHRTQRLIVVLRSLCGGSRARGGANQARHCQRPWRRPSSFAPGSLCTSSLHGVMRGRRQNRRPVRGTLFLLHFEFGGQNRGRGRRNRHGT